MDRLYRTLGCTQSAAESVSVVPSSSSSPSPRIRQIRSSHNAAATISRPATIAATDATRAPGSQDVPLAGEPHEETGVHAGRNGACAGGGHRQGSGACGHERVDGALTDTFADAERPEEQRQGQNRQRGGGGPHHWNTAPAMSSTRSASTQPATALTTPRVISSRALVGVTVPLYAATAREVELLHRHRVAHRDNRTAVREHELRVRLRPKGSTKSALSRPRMRQCQVRIVADAITKSQHVDVKGARTPAGPRGCGPLPCSARWAAASTC